MNRLLLLITCLALVPRVGRADASNLCMWVLLVDTHAVAAHCGKPLDGPSEQRYRQLRQAAEAEIIRDASLSPGGSPVKAKTFIANYIAHGSLEARSAFPAYCASKDAPMVIDMLERFTTSENTAKILAGLAARKNPFEGECL